MQGTLEAHITDALENDFFPLSNGLKGVEHRTATPGNPTSDQSSSLST